MSTVLVTGGAGFIGSHAILQLLAAGHAVRTTIRDLERVGDVRAMLAAGGGNADAPLDFLALVATAESLARFGLLKGQAAAA